MRLNTNNVLEGLNLLMSGLSLGVIAVSAWLATHSRHDCLIFLQWPFMAIGLLIFCVGLLGYFASSRRNKPLLLLYIILLILISLLFLAFTLFALVVTAEYGNGQAIAGARFREYSTADFSPWLQKRVSQPYWSSIQACLSRGRLCNNLALKYKTRKQFYAADLSPTEVGCCKPPSECGFVFETPTMWGEPIMSRAEKGSQECFKWSNKPSQLCFACDTCRAGEMRNIRQHWLNVAIVSLIVALLLLTLLAIASMALCNVKHSAIPDEPKLHSPYI